MSAEPKPSPASTVLYQERLWPAFWVWVVAAGVAAASILVFAPISMTAGIISAIVVAVVLAVLLVLSSPRIVVTGQYLSVGRAQIERRYLGTVDGFLGEDAVQQRGPALDGTAYLCIRGWISPVVRIEITDPADRTPYWLTSTRRPKQLTAALTTS